MEASWPLAAYKYAVGSCCSLHKVPNPGRGESLYVLGRAKTNVYKKIGRAHVFATSGVFQQRLQPISEIYCFQAYTSRFTACWCSKFGSLLRSSERCNNLSTSCMAANFAFTKVVAVMPATRLSIIIIDCHLGIAHILVRCLL